MNNPVRGEHCWDGAAMDPRDPFSEESFRYGLNASVGKTGASQLSR